MNPRAFRKSDAIAVDYETSGFVFDPGARVFSVSYCWIKDGHIEIYRENNPLFEERIVDFWNSECEGAAHHLKFELHFTDIHHWKINPRKILHCTMIQHQYIDNISPRHGLDWIAYKLAGHCDSSKRWRDCDDSIVAARKIYGTYDKIPEYLMHPYQIADAERGALLHAVQIKETMPVSEYRNEIDLIKTTVKMERRGFTLDKLNTDAIIKDLSFKKEQNEANAKKILGKIDINLLSEKQVKKLLYYDLGLPRQDCIDEDALDTIAKTHPHPILDCIIRARSYTKGLAVLKGYQESAQHDGRIRSTINTNKATTGRETSENPNGQNVPREIKANVKYPIPARRCFRARPGFFLMLGDYSGIEMRLAVQGTGSRRLIEMCDADFDFHDAFAKLIYGKRYTDEPNKAIKKALRNMAKNGRFAMLYGCGPDILCTTLEIPFEQAVVAMARDKAEFPELYDYMLQCMNTVNACGRIETFFGRSLRVPHDRPYAATDYAIQGTAAAVIKHAQVAVDEYIHSEIGDDLAGILLPVHDEIVMEFHRSLLPRINSIMKDIKHTMISWPQITVKMNVEFGISFRSWGDRHDFIIAE